MAALADRIATGLGLLPEAVAGCVELLDAGNTVPFIARYRKERTHGLDEVQIRAVQEQHRAMLELLARRDTVLKTIAAQGVLTDALRASIESCWDRAVLEDIYLPFKPRRRTRASVARDAGLEPLADIVAAQVLQHGTPLDAARPFVNSEKGIETTDAALHGACDILAERYAENANLRGRLRDWASETAVLCARPHRGVDPEVLQRFRDYSDYRELARRVPSHRYLAVSRGEAEKALSVGLEMDAV